MTKRKSRTIAVLAAALLSVPLLTGASRPEGNAASFIEGIGHYSFDANGHFSYAYDNSETITENSSGLKVDRKLPWTGEKVFTQVESTPTSLRIKTADGGTEFYFTKTSFAASDHGKPLRSYKRVMK